MRHYKYSKISTKQPFLLVLFTVFIIINVCGCSNAAQSANSTRQAVIVPLDNNENLIIEAIDKVAVANGLKKISVVTIDKGSLVYQDVENSVQTISVWKSNNNIVVDCKSMPPAMVQSGSVLSAFRGIVNLDKHFKVKITNTLDESKMIKN